MRRLRSGKAWANLTPQEMLSRPPSARGIPIRQST